MTSGLKFREERDFTNYAAKNKFLSALLFAGTVVVTNVALGKNVTMSSLYTSTQYGDGTWAYAVDGNTNQDWSDGGCAGTNLDTNPWLFIDLWGIYTVTSLKIYDRVDYDCKYVMSRVLKKPTFYISENKGADQQLISAFVFAT